jgi:hypothetical protein
LNSETRRSNPSDKVDKWRSKLEHTQVTKQGMKHYQSDYTIDNLNYIAVKKVFSLPETRFFVWVHPTYGF